MKNITIKFCRDATPEDGLIMTEEQFYDCIRNFFNNEDNLTLGEAKKVFGNSYRFCYRISEEKKWIDPQTGKEYRISYMQIKRKNSRYIPFKSIQACDIFTSKKRGFYKEHGLEWADSLLDPVKRIPTGVVELSQIWPEK